jgi:outer membrane protein OmpA-like peptidoglycan-associated protein
MAVVFMAGAAAFPAQAQPDAATQRLIEQLRPQNPEALNATRGLRRPPATSDAPPVPVLVPGQATQAAPPRPAPLASPSPPPASTPVQAARPAVRPTTTAPAGVPAASLTVNFATGSDRLTPSAMRELDRLGRALTSQELAPYRFRIEGHTDTVGSASLNQTLSERRAASVGRYLQERFGVSPSRLETIGLGQTQLLVPTPDGTPNADNRRVQVINLGQ